MKSERDIIYKNKIGKYLYGIIFCFFFTSLLYLPINHPVSLNLDSNYYYKIASEYLEYFAQGNLFKENKQDFAIATTSDFEKANEDTWIFQKLSNSNTISCWFTTVEAKQTQGKTFKSSSTIVSDCDLKIQALLCSHNVAYDGSSATYNLKANEPLEINLSHQFKLDSPAVKLQINVSGHNEQKAEIKIKDIQIKEERKSLLSLLKKMSHFLYPASVALVQKWTALEVSSSGVLVLFTFQILLAFVIYVSLLNESVLLLPSPLQLVFLTLSLLLVSHIPVLYFVDQHMYKGYIAPVVYHNATMATLKPFSLLLFLASLKIFQKNENNVSSIFICFLLVFLCSFSKPSFTIIILPSILFLALIWLLLKKPLNWSILIFGIVVPSILILAFQFFLTYTGTKAGGLQFKPFAVMLHHSGYLLPKFLLSIAFPLSVLIIYYRTFFNTALMPLAWLIAIFGFVFTYLFAESGPRFAHGNFGWSGQIGLFIIFFASVVFLIKSTAADCFLKWKSLLANKRLCICLTVYFIHFCSGLIWWYSTASLCMNNISPRTIW